MFKVHENEPKLFENLKELLKPKDVFEKVGIPRSIVYDWIYRPERYDYPPEMVFKIGRNVYVRKTILRDWILSK